MRKFLLHFISNNLHQCYGHSALVIRENLKRVLKRVKFPVDMLPTRCSVFLILALFISHVKLSSSEAEERKNFRTILDLLTAITDGFYSEPNGISPSNRLDCPLCDTSVYSYCSEKLLHDACCCLNPYEHKLPNQCKYADCGFLHANSCREHKLITACCCSKLL